MKPPRILIVEDEEALTLLLRYNLEAEGYEVETVGARRRGRAAAAGERRPISSCSTGCCRACPASSSAGGCARGRETEQLPIIMLTARGEESERVRGLVDRRRRLRRQAVLGAGADRARARAAAPRARRSASPTCSTLGDIELDREKKRVSRARPRRSISARPNIRLLEFLMEQPGRVFSREQLLDGVWGSRHLYRRAHRRRACRPAAQGAQPRPRDRSDPHRARRRLRAR